MCVDKANCCNQKIPHAMTIQCCCVLWKKSFSFKIAFIFTQFILPGSHYIVSQVRMGWDFIKMLLNTLRLKKLSIYIYCLMQVIANMIRLLWNDYVGWLYNCHEFVFFHQFNLLFFSQTCRFWWWLHHFLQWWWVDGCSQWCTEWSLQDVHQR